MREPQLAFAVLEGTFDRQSTEADPQRVFDSCCFGRLDQEVFFVETTDRLDVPLLCDLCALPAGGGTSLTDWGIVQVNLLTGNVNELRDSKRNSKRHTLRMLCAQR